MLHPSHDLRRRTRPLWRWVGCSIGMALAACGDSPVAPPAESWTWEFPYVGAPCDLASPGPSLEPLRRDSVPDPGTSHHGDRVTVARDAPGGFGGVFFDGRGQVVYLVEPDSASAALPALRTLGVTRWATFVRARWDYAQLYEWYAYLQLHGVHSIDGVYGSSISEGRNRLRYDVREEGLGAIASLLASLDVPCGLVSVDVAPEPLVVDQLLPGSS